MAKSVLQIVAVLAAMLCPIALSAPAVAADKPMTTKDWWPTVLDLSPLRQHDEGANPYGPGFNYAAGSAW